MNLKIIKSSNHAYKYFKVYINIYLWIAYSFARPK